MRKENRDGLLSPLDNNTMRRPHRQVWNHAVHTGVLKRGERVAAVGKSCAERMRRRHPTACCLRIDASGGARVAPLSCPFTHTHIYNQTHTKTDITAAAAPVAGWLQHGRGLLVLSLSLTLSLSLSQQKFHNPSVLIYSTLVYFIIAPN